MSLDDGIRRLCSYFTLPNEKAQVDPIMEKFAEKYCLQNEDIFNEENDAYILSYAVIMLNVNLWHPSIPNRITKEALVKSLLSGRYQSNAMDNFKYTSSTAS